MKQEIKNIGSIQKLDKDGYIINDFSLDNIQVGYINVLKDIIDLYQDHFSEYLHSIYLRGSVAKGQAIPYLSDIDTVAISNIKLPDEINKKRELIWKEIGDKYPFIKGVEIHFESLDNVMNSENFQFLLKTQCIPVYGNNIIETLPKFKIGKAAFAHSSTLEKDIKSVEEWLENETDVEEIKDICMWIMKRIVRIGFELIMEKEKCFTRDLYPCYDLFSKNYPNKKDEMHQAIFLAVFPSDNKDLILSTIQSISSFLLGEIKNLSS